LAKIATAGPFQENALQEADEFLAHEVDLNAWRGGLNPVKFRCMSQILRGMICIKEDYPAAIASFGDAIETNPKVAQAYYLRARRTASPGSTKLRSMSSMCDEGLLIKVGHDRYRAASLKAA
jgi:hypothetical protein